MTEEINLNPSSDERLMGALSHLFGVVGALIIWMMQKDKSRFVRFQAAQALVFGLTVMVIMGIVFFCLFGTLFIGIFGTMFSSVNAQTVHENSNIFMIMPFLFPFLTFSCIFPFSLILLITRVVATISVLTGRDFHYPILGNQVEKFLEN